MVTDDWLARLAVGSFGTAGLRPSAQYGYSCWLPCFLPLWCLWCCTSSSSTDNRACHPCKRLGWPSTQSVQAPPVNLSLTCLWPALFCKLTLPGQPILLTIGPLLVAAWILNRGPWTLDLFSAFPHSTLHSPRPSATLIPFHHRRLLFSFISSLVLSHTSMRH